MQPLLILLAVLLTIGGFGTWKVLRHQRHRVEIQLRLDHSTGDTALRFRNLQNRLVLQNREIKALRATAAALSVINPPGAESAKIASRAIAFTQDVDVVKLQSEWALARITGMQISFDEEYSLPPWTRPPEDVWGPQELHWNGGTGVTFESKINQIRSRAAAYLSRRRWHAVFL